MPPVVAMFTDGACSGNPGPGGWGVLLRSGQHEKTICGGQFATTNNQMELTAVIEGLKLLKRPCHLTIYTDSQYVQKGVSEWLEKWKTNQWRTSDRKPVKNKTLWEELDNLIHTHKIDWVWIRGHSGHPENELADALAREGMQPYLRGKHDI
jgi:ribonuclease HI